MPFIIFKIFAFYQFAPFIFFCILSFFAFLSAISLQFDTTNKPLDFNEENKKENDLMLNNSAISKSFELQKI